MSLFEDTNPRALKDLLSEIHNRTTVLPDFQRNFVWEPGATQELIVSIASNYPAGSILRVRDAKRVFAAREFEGSPSLDGAKHTFLVLDGQQRLTSLYQAFYGVGDHRYFLSLGKLTDGSDFEDAIFHIRATTKWAKAREDFALQAKELLLPLSVLKGGAGGFGRWGRQVARQLADRERIVLEDALDSIEEMWINVIDDYHFPVVTLSEKTEADALCTIFETLNRTGVKLSDFRVADRAVLAAERKAARVVGESTRGSSGDRGLRGRSLLRSARYLAREPQGAVVQAQRRAEHGCVRHHNLVAIRVGTWLSLATDRARDPARRLQAVTLPKWVPVPVPCCRHSPQCWLGRGQFPKTAEAGAIARKAQSLVLVRGFLR